MKYLANSDFEYAIKHVTHVFKKDQEVIVPESEVAYMLAQKFIREEKGKTQAPDSTMTVEQLKKAIAKLSEKISKEMNEDKLKELDSKKQEFEAKLAELEA